MGSRTRKTLAVAALVGTLGLGLSAAAPASARGDGWDGAGRLTCTGVEGFLQALLARLINVWAADSPGADPNGTPTH